MFCKGFGLILMVIIAFPALAQDYVRPAFEEKNTTTEPPSVQSSNTKKFSMSINIGVAIPTSQFASTDAQGGFWDMQSLDSVHLQGYAKTGFHFDITATYMINDFAGITAVIGSNNNMLDVNTFAIATNAPSSISPSSYTTTEYMIGPYFSYALGLQKKLKLSAYGMIGLMVNSYPEVNRAVQNDTVIWTVDFPSGTGFAYSFGGVIAYSLGRSIDLQLMLGYSAANVKYNGWTDTYSTPGYYPLTFSHNNTEKMNVGIVKATIGLAFRL